MVPLVTRLLHSARRGQELCHLTTFVTFPDHTSSDGNSRRIQLQLLQITPAVRATRAVSGFSLEVEDRPSLKLAYFPTCQHLGARQILELLATLARAWRDHVLPLVPHV